MEAVYGPSGAVVAWLDGSTLYGLAGEPQGWIRQQHVFAYSGDHCGWLRGGLFRDHQGAVVAFTEKPRGGSRPILPVKQVRPVRPVRQVRPVRPIPSVPPVRPVDQVAWSRLSWEAYVAR